MITEEEVLKIAKLAKLSLDSEEIKLYSEQLRDIIKYVEQLNELDTTDVPPTPRAIPVHNVFREDNNTRTLNTEEIFQNAPEKENNMFKVPKI